MADTWGAKAKAEDHHTRLFRITYERDAFGAAFSAFENPVGEMGVEWFTVIRGAPLDIAMARAPLEDCLQRIPNHFDLCAIASKRARQLARGAPSDIPVNSHKSTVLSLMENSRGLVDRTVLDEQDLPTAEAAAVRFDPLELGYE